MIMSPNKDETAADGCSSYLYCSYSGEVGCAHACRSGWGNERSAVAEVMCGAGVGPGYKGALILRPAQFNS